MSALLWAELRRSWATWVGLVAIAVIAAVSFSVAIAMVEAGLREGGEILESSFSFLSMLLMVNVPAGAIVVAAIARLAVDLHRSAYARWQLAGVSPAQTSMIVLAQLLSIGVLSGIVGFSVSVLFVPRFLHAVFSSDSTWWSTATIIPGALTAWIVIPLTTVVVLAGGLRAALSAGKTAPLAALREPEAQAKRMRWWRWILFLVVLLAAGVGGALAPFRVDTRSTAVSQYPLIPLYLTVILAALGPVLYPFVLRAWTALIPARVSTSWYLARHQARYHLGRSTASITPLFVGASLLGGLMTMSATTSAAITAAGLPGSFDLGLLQVMLLIGGPVVLGAAGAGTVLFMSNRTQGGEQALLRASGATSSTVWTAAFWQALIHVVTAFFLAVIVTLGTAAIVSGSLSRFIPATPVIDLDAALLLVAAGLTVTLAATTVPALIRLREPLAPQLAAT